MTKGRERKEEEEKEKKMHEGKISKNEMWGQGESREEGTVRK
jgi:hypothetical protein